MRKILASSMKKVNDLNSDNTITHDGLAFILHHKITDIPISFLKILIATHNLITYRAQITSEKDYDTGHTTNNYSPKTDTTITLNGLSLLMLIKPDLHQSLDQQIAATLIKKSIRELIKLKKTLATVMPDEYVNNKNYTYHHRYHETRNQYYLDVYKNNNLNSRLCYELWVDTVRFENIAEDTTLDCTHRFTPKPSTINQAIATLLMMRHTYNKNTTYTLADKIILKNYYLGKIKTIDGTSGLQTIKADIEKNAVVNYRRYHLFDNLCGRTKQPTHTMQILQEALADKENQLKSKIGVHSL